MERGKMIEMIKGNDPLKKTEALMYIAEHRIPFPLVHIHRALQDKVINVRAAAAFALGKVGRVSSVSYLVRAWRSSAKHYNLRRQLLIALQDIAGINGINKIVYDFSRWDITLQELAVDYVVAATKERGRSNFIRVIMRQPLSKKTKLLLAEKNIPGHAK